MSIVNKHPDKMSPLGISLVANDGITTSGVAHRSLAENGHNDVLLKYMEDALQKHHISPDALQRHMDLIKSKVSRYSAPLIHRILQHRKEILLKFSWRNI